MEELEDNPLFNGLHDFYKYIYIYIYKNIHTYVYTYVCVCVCIYVYVYCLILGKVVCVHVHSAVSEAV